MLKQFRMWCETEQDHVFVWSETAPTECPNDSGHTIKADTTVRVAVEKITNIQQVDVDGNSKNSSYKTLARVIYLGRENVGDIKSIDVVSYMDSGATSYDMRVVDKGNDSSVIASVTGLTNTEDDIVSLGTISNLPEEKTRFDIQVRKNGGNNSHYVYVDSILVKY